MLPHKSPSLPPLPERAWGNVSRQWLILVVGLGAACSWIQWKPSNEQSCVCLCPGRAPQSAERCMQACIMSGACSAQVRGYARRHALWGCRRLSVMRVFGLFWDYERLLDEDKTEENRHYIILKRVNSHGPAWECRQRFLTQVPRLGQDTAHWAISNVLLASNSVRSKLCDRFSNSF